MSFSIQDVVLATNGKLQAPDRASEFQSVHTKLPIETDSRSIKAPCLFWALPGERYDGHAFIPQAINAGAVACVVRSGTQIEPDLKAAVIEVADPLEALGDLARWHRLRLPIPVIGITGSYGKTTTRELIACVLSQRFRVFQSQKNFNNDVGLPLCLFDLGPQHEIAVLELGASAIGDIRRLCRIAMPNYGVITGIGRAHSETFGGVLKTREAKSELVQCLPSDGRAYLPLNDPEFEFLNSKAPCTVSTIAELADSSPLPTSISGMTLQAEQVAFRNGHIEFTCDAQPFRFRAAGKHFVRNALFAIAIGRDFGLTDAEIAHGLAEFQPVSGRCQILNIGEWTVIDDTYNASPETMQAACRTLGNWPASRRILVTGDMLALGADAEQGHRDVGIAAGQAGIDVVLSLGEHAEIVVDAARSAGTSIRQSDAFADLQALLTRLEQELSSGAVVLVKGSRGMRMERVVQWLKEHSQPEVAI